MDFNHNITKLDIGHGMDGWENAPMVKVLSNLHLEVKFRVTALSHIPKS